MERLSETRVAYKARVEASEVIARAADIRSNGRLGTAARRLLGDRLPAYWYDRRPNFGDLVAPAIVQHMFGVKLQVVHSTAQRKILTVGSILHLALQRGDVVWGSGAIEDKPIDVPDTTFFAVRGPRTRQLINGDVPEVYGDPGSLLPKLYTPSRTARRFAVGLMPHMFDQDVMVSDDPSVATIDVRTWDWRGTVDQIAACDVVVSSSLHGLVVAEAYGIPAVWVQPTDRLTGGEFKFRDYYEATGRDGTLHDWRDGLSTLVDRAESPPPIDTDPLVKSWPYEPSPSAAS